MNEPHPHAALGAPALPFSGKPSEERRDPIIGRMKEYLLGAAGPHPEGKKLSAARRSRKEVVLVHTHTPRRKEGKSSSDRPSLQSPK